MKIAELVTERGLRGNDMGDVKKQTILKKVEKGLKEFGLGVEIDYTTCEILGVRIDK